MEPIGEFGLREAAKAMLVASMAPGVRIYEELSVLEGSARVDLALVGDRLDGFEIKSDFDTCKRLPSQVKAFNRVFDTMTIITGPVLMREASTAIPKWWGIIGAWRKANGEIVLQWTRRAQANPARCAFSLAQFLWKEEACEELARHLRKSVPARTTRAQLQARLAEQLDADRMRDAVIGYLHKRPVRTKSEAPKEAWIDLDPDWLYPELYGPRSGTGALTAQMG